MVHFEHSLPTLSHRMLNTCCFRYVGKVVKVSKTEILNPDHRYAAVCQPYSYNTRETSMRPSTRLVQILTPVLLLSILVNIPRSETNLSICKYFEICKRPDYRYFPPQILRGGDFDRNAQCHTWWKLDERARVRHLRNHRPTDGPYLHQVAYRKPTLGAKYIDMKCLKRKNTGT